jgi:hypothetical protein
MAVSKTPGQTCYVTIASIDYMGPPVTVWLFGLITQGPLERITSFKYISDTYPVELPGASSWVTVPIGIEIVMRPYIRTISEGLADCHLMIWNGSDTSQAQRLYVESWSGAFSFVYPASAWRGASGTFAAQVSGLEAQFGVMR